MCRVKKPWFCVEKDGYPLTAWLLILDDSHAPEAPARLGLDLPLLMFNPGLDQPPPGTGEGLRERVIPAGTGVPIGSEQTQRLARGSGDCVTKQWGRGGRDGGDCCCAGEDK